MKKFLVGILLVVLAVNTHAQWYSRKYDANNLSDISKTQLTQALQQTKGKITAGKLLTVAGIGCEIIGVSLVLNNFCISDCSQENTTESNTGGVLMVAGLIGMAGGITMWAVNGSRRKDIEVALALLNASSYSGNNGQAYPGYKQPSAPVLSLKIKF